MHCLQPSLRNTTSTLLLGIVLAASACLPFGLGGTLNEAELAFEGAVYFELRGTDTGTSTPFHDIQLWLTPLEDPCERLPALLAELASLRRQQQDGLPPTDYCEAWEDVMEGYLGLEPFWHAQVRMKALPSRSEDETPKTQYDYHDETSTELADAPSFDADILYYPRPDFDACAEEFAGTTSYAATEYPALGGESVIKSYNQDSEIGTVLSVHLGSADTSPFEGAAKAEFCIPAQNWPLHFGLGL